MKVNLETETKKCHFGSVENFLRNRGGETTTPPVTQSSVSQSFRQEFRMAKKGKAEIQCTASWMKEEKGGKSLTFLKEWKPNEGSGGGSSSIKNPSSSAFFLLTFLRRGLTDIVEIAGEGEGGKSELMQHWQQQTEWTSLPRFGFLAPPAMPQPANVRRALEGDALAGRERRFSAGG